MKEDMQRPEEDAGTGGGVWGGGGDELRDTEGSSRSRHISRKCVCVCVNSLHNDYTDHRSEAAAFKAAEETFLLHNQPVTHRLQRHTAIIHDVCLCVRVCACVYVYK